MPSMYDPLRDFLKTIDNDAVTLTFEEINTLINKQHPAKKLPPTAYKKPEWWSNNSLGHTQCISWNGAGWLVAKGGIKLGESISFARE